MTQHYSNPEREDEETALPDIEVFELTAREVAEMDDEAVNEFIKANRPKYDLAGMNSRDTERMYDAMIEEEGIQGGWFWWSCFPGCLPDSSPMGPFASHAEALKDAQNTD
jgi:hypothetical protein